MKYTKNLIPASVNRQAMSFACNSESWICALQATLPMMQLIPNFVSSGGNYDTSVLLPQLWQTSWEVG